MYILYLFVFYLVLFFFFFFKQKTAYEMRISDWSSDVCSSDLVGALAGILEILDPDRSADFVNPFDIICGSSAGAINAAAMGCRANDPHLAVDRLQKLWGTLHTGDVYHADAAGLLRKGLRWFAMLALGWRLPDLRNRGRKSTRR